MRKLEKRVNRQSKQVQRVSRAGTRLHRVDGGDEKFKVVCKEFKLHSRESCNFLMETSSVQNLEHERSQYLKAIQEVTEQSVDSEKEENPKGCILAFLSIDIRQACLSWIPSIFKKQLQMIFALGERLFGQGGTQEATNIGNWDNKKKVDGWRAMLNKFNVDIQKTALKRG